MRRLLVGIILGSVCSVFAQDAAQMVSQGVPAKLVASNDKVANVLVQKMSDGKLTFGIFKSERVMTVPADRVKSLEFVKVDIDAAAVDSSYSSADYAAVLSALSPVMDELMPCMVISNNLQDRAVQMMQSYRGLGQWDKVVEVATVLKGSGSKEISQKAEMMLALASLANGDLEGVRSYMNGLEDGAAKRYLQALILSAEGDNVAAHLVVCSLIKDYGNNMAWLPEAELLSARLYKVRTLGDADAMALGTASQVANIYAGTHIAGDALKFKSELELEIEKRKENEGESDE